MLIRLLVSHLRRYRRVLVAVAVLQLLQTLATLYLPILNADIIDNGVETGDTAYIWRTGLLMLAVTLVQISFAIGAVYYGSRASMGFGRDVRFSLFHRVTGFSTREVNELGAPSLITRITNDVQQVQMLLFLTCTLLIAAPVMAVGGVILAVRVDGGLSLVLFVSIPVLLIGVWSVIRRMVPQYRLMQVRIDLVNRVLREQITGMRVVRAFVREPEETARFGAANDDLTQTSLIAGRLMALMFPIVTIVLNVSSVAVIWLGAGRISDGDLSIGALIAFLTYLAQILTAVMMATFMAVLVPRATVCAERIQEVLDTEPSVAAPAAPVTLLRSRGSLELRGAGFAYPGSDEPVLADISLVSLAGQTTAVVGSTGAGKTTLLNLVPRLFDVTVGCRARRRRRRPRARSRAAVGPHRSRAAAALPVLGHGGEQRALRQGRRHRRGGLGGARDRPGPGLRVGHAGPARRPHRAGRHERLRGAAPAPGHGSSPRPPARDLPLRRLLLGARPRDGCPPAGRPRAVHRGCHRAGGGPARLDDRHCRPDPRARGRTDRRPRDPRCAARQLPHLRRDRRIPDLRQGRGVSTDRREDQGDDGPVRPPASEIRGGFGSGRITSAAVPLERSLEFRASTRRLLRRMGPDRRRLILVVVFAVVSVFLVVLAPKVLGHATDLIVSGVSGSGIDFAELDRTLLTALGLYAVSAVLAYLQAYVLAGVVQRTMHGLRAEVEVKLNALPLGYIDGQPRGDLLSRVTNDIDNIAQSLQQTLSQLLTSVLTIAGVLVMMIVISPLLALVTVVTVPLSLFTIKTIAKRAQPRFVAQWRHTGALNALVEETFTGHALVKAYGRQQEVETRFADENEKLYTASFGAQFVSGIIQPSMMFIGNLNFVAIAVIGGLRVAAGALTIGDIQAFIQYSRQFTQPLTQVASMMNVLQSGIASAERVFELLDAPEQDPDADPPAVVDELRGRIEFEHVWFSYDPAVPLIKDLSLVAEPGRTVAIVGPTGAGKTTLVNLIMRFYELDRGRITLDGEDIAHMRRRDLRASVGMVLQDTWLFGGTIHDNIAYGNPDATDDDILAAARAAYVDRFVHSLPHGYATIVDDEGASLSAGEKQLLTIARAFLADPAILILDEATSSVDTRTEVLVQQAMAALRSRRTSFVIAHRLSTIRDADTILVMDAGQIVEQGSHTELLAAGGAYAALYNAQFVGAAVEVT